MSLVGLERTKKAIDKLVSNTNNDIKGVYLSGLSQIVQESPVDEGRFRNNWFLTVGTASSASTTAKSKGLGSIRQLKKMPKSVLGKKIYFTNNLPYARAIEYGGLTDKPETEKTIGGFSKQAPSGVVRKTLIKMQQRIKNL